MNHTALSKMTKEELIALALSVQVEKAAVESEKAAVESENIALIAEKAALVAKNMDIMHQLDKLRRHIFGQKAERFIPVDPNQLQIDFGKLMEVAKAEAETEKISYERKKPAAKAKPVRQAIPDDLPRIVEVIEPDEDVSEMVYIGDEVTEELEYTPGKLFVKQYRRRKYVAKTDTDKTKIICANLPSRPIEKGIPGPSLLAWIIIEKYLWHIPFYRQWQRLASWGIKIPTSTMNDWFARCSELLQPLYEELRRQSLASNYLQVDETPIKVLESTKSGAPHRGFYWVYHAPLHKTVVFDYQTSRSKAGPTRMLIGYKGWLQVDGYAVYDDFEEREGIHLVGCLAHLRRYFEQALKSDKENASWMMGKIAELYDIEREAREAEMSHEERKALRELHSQPIIKEISLWLMNNREKFLPKSPMGKAIYYALGRMNYIARIVQDGRLEIDNNLVENAIRPIAIGRKNYLFAGNHNAAQNAAIIYSLLGTAKMNGIDPQAWLTETLSKISDHPINRIAELLPVLRA